MKPLFKLFLPLCILAACGGTSADPEEEEIPAPAPQGPVVKVMSYNIHIGNPPSKPADYRELEAAANVINLQKPDLVALQEVDVNTRRSGSTVDQAKELARLTGMHYYYTKAIDYQGGQFGDAVLSRLPILEKRRYELPVTSQLGGETRSVALITVEKEGHKFHFASTHLDHLGPEDNRILQANELVKVVKELTLPLIIAGDLNAVPTSTTMGILFQQLSSGCQSACPFTFPAINPTRTIDYIMVHPLNKFNIKSYRTITETYASDHLPLVSEIQLKK
ncbi:endonuclease/exonuclease/phosphatase family protein [Rufibacter ruber]|uniref:endonuclease/exonuclease/phosphatase family protein n=1 Tax=Rufibacter ruber TaxID=1783499 RepID=UPI0008340A48|nr:endonuclease/exonuclease/phosphatase family protein [Rufibacter ruber]